MKINAIYIGKYRSQNSVYKYYKLQDHQIKDDIQQLPKKLIALNSKPNQRNKLKTNYGIWFVLHDGQWAFGLCTCDDYPERHAYKFIQDIKHFVIKNKNTTDTNLEKLLKNYLKQNINKYQQLSKIDKIYQANQQVGKLQQQLQLGIKKIIGNQENLNELDQKAQTMKTFAKEFNNNCKTLERITFWEKWKFILIIIAVSLGILSFIAIILLIKL